MSTLRIARPLEPPTHSTALGLLGHASINTTTMYAHISTSLRTATAVRLLEDGG